MAGLYLVGTWLLVQVASTLFPAFDVPGWAFRGVVVMLAHRQGKIVTALRGSLVVNKAMPVVGVQADTYNVQAYVIYLKARELLNARKDIDESVRLFGRHWSWPTGISAT